MCSSDLECGSETEFDVIILRYECWLSFTSETKFVIGLPLFKCLV